MRTQIQTSSKEIKFFVLTAMIFAVCEVLSIELNNYFRVINILGYNFEFNVSVVYFCIGFFIIDLITELYDNKVANYFIYSKLISQAIFVLLGYVGVYGAAIANGQIAESFRLAPLIFINGMVASLLAYKLTGKIMYVLKVKFKGKFMFGRYLSSTFPGEVAFSLIFTLLTFSTHRNFNEVLNIFIDLIAVKFVLSFIFSLLAVPVTNLLRHYLEQELTYEGQSMPFK